MHQATDTDTAMMRRALELAAEAAANGEVPVGAVVYRDQDLLAEAYNCRESQKDPTAHAEIIALRGAAQAIGSWRLDGCCIAVTLEPCPMCAGAMVNSRIQRLVYGAADPKMGCAGTLYELCSDQRFNHCVEVIAGVLADQAAALLQDFFHSRRGHENADTPGN